MKRLEKHIIAQARTFASERMRPLNSSHGWDHVERVLLIAERIARTERDADPFIVKTAAILHDIARIEEAERHGAVCHADLGSRIAYDALIGWGLDEVRADRVRRCILTHRYRNNHAPDGIEARILYDADKLDSIGAVGVGRAFLFSGEVGAKLHNTDAEASRSRAYSPEDTAFREFLLKLRFIKETMMTAEGRRLADERHRFMVEFFERLQKEADGSL